MTVNVAVPAAPAARVFVSVVAVHPAGSPEAVNAKLSLASPVFITGTLTVADGGKVTSTDSDIGFAATGTATVTGAGSTWTSDYLAVGLYGNDGDGTLTVAEGGKVVAPTVLIGLNYGSAGTINIGAAAGEAAVAAGTLDAATIEFDIKGGNDAPTITAGGEVFTHLVEAGLDGAGQGAVSASPIQLDDPDTGDSPSFSGITGA